MKKIGFTLWLIARKAACSLNSIVSFQLLNCTNKTLFDIEEGL